jgi:hypothetical protein
VRLYYRVAQNLQKGVQYRFSNAEFKKFKQVAIFARRTKHCDGLYLVHSLQNQFLDPEKIPYLSDICEGIYPLSGKGKSVDLFKGAVFNVSELARQMAKSSSMDILFDVSRLEGVEKHPPLPLNIGQIGLLGGSGMMNGLIDCDTPHIVKDNVIKQRKSEITEKKENTKSIHTELREVTSKGMIFSLLTADGFKSLN